MVGEGPRLTECVCCGGYGVDEGGSGVPQRALMWLSVLPPPLDVSRGAGVDGGAKVLRRGLGTAWSVGEASWWRCGWCWGSGLLSCGGNVPWGWSGGLVVPGR